MPSSAPLLIEDANLSFAWGRSLIQIVDNPGTKISPLIISIVGFDRGRAQENNKIRIALDTALGNIGEQPVHTVANTIFPESLWRLAGGDRHRLFKLYLRNLPRLRALEPRKNRRGLYFERLINFGENSVASNQLEFIINQHNSRSGVRCSMFQAAIFDPNRDHDPTARLGFPCMQHISFVPSNNGLTMNSFYATQQLLQKGYGNFLGLCRLGNFMAREMGLTLERMNCFIGVEKLEVKSGKGSLNMKNLIQIVRDVITHAIQ